MDQAIIYGLDFIREELYRIEKLYITNDFPVQDTFPKYDRQIVKVDEKNRNYNRIKEFGGALALGFY